MMEQKENVRIEDGSDEALFNFPHIPFSQIK